MSERPASLSPEQMQLVLKRAVELDSRSAATSTGTLPDTTTEPELARLAEEVGLAPAAVQRALAELKVGALTRSTSRGVLTRTLDATYGAGELELERELPATGNGANDQLSRELQKRLLRIKRRLGETTVWEPDRSPQAMLTRLADFSRKYDVGLADELETLAVDSGGASGTPQALVRLSARLPERRRRAMLYSGLGGASAAGMVAFMGWVFGGFSTLDAVLTASAAVGAAGWFRGRFRRGVERLQVAMEQLLDGTIGADKR